jgi:hypothetical protein
MRYVAGAVLFLCLLLVGCGGDDEPQGTPVATHSVEPTAAAGQTPTPQAPALGIVALPPLPAARTLTLTPAPEILQQPGAMAPDKTQTLFYAMQSGRLTALERSFGPANWGWTPAGPALVSTTSGLVLYNVASNTAQRFDLADDMWTVLIARTPRAALQLTSGQLALLDLTTWQYQPVSLNAQPTAWSPDGKRLLVAIPGGGPAVLLLDTATPRLYTLPTPIGGRYVGWVSDTSLLQLVPPLSAHTVEISGPSPRVTVRPLDAQQASIHRGAVRLAASNFTQGGVSIYDALSLQKQRDVLGASLGQSLDVSNTMWSADSRLILLQADFCLDTERIILYDVVTGTSTDVAKAMAFEMALSPDNRQVAYTQMTGAYLVPADGSAAPRLLYDKVAAPGPITWSADGSAIGFTHFGGGYDRCVGVGNR